MTKSVLAKLILSSLLFLAFTCFSFGDAKTPLLLQTPTISKNQIAFVYGGDIWIVGREGGEAQRLVTGTGFGKRAYLFAGWLDGRV